MHALSHCWCSLRRRFRVFFDGFVQAIENDIDIEGACGGTLACSTCHLYIDEDSFDKLPEIDEEEEDMLDLAFGLQDL